MTVNKKVQMPSGRFVDIPASQKREVWTLELLKCLLSAQYLIVTVCWSFPSYRHIVACWFPWLSGTEFPCNEFTQLDLSSTSRSPIVFQEFRTTFIFSNLQSSCHNSWLPFGTQSRKRWTLLQLPIFQRARLLRHSISGPPRTIAFFRHNVSSCWMRNFPVRSNRSHFRPFLSELTSRPAIQNLLIRIREREEAIKWKRGYTRTGFTLSLSLALFYRHFCYCSRSTSVLEMTLSRRFMFVRPIAFTTLVAIGGRAGERERASIRPVGRQSARRKEGREKKEDWARLVESINAHKYAGSEPKWGKVKGSSHSAQTATDRPPYTT